jgi:mercuric ion transport protein
MKEFVKQCPSSAGAASAGACCLGVTGALSALSAVGAGFLVNDAFLIPLFLGLLALSVWLLYASARGRGRLAPAWCGLVAALVAFAGLWISPVLVFGGIAVLIACSVWDYRNLRAARVSTSPSH